VHQLLCCHQLWDLCIAVVLCTWEALTDCPDGYILIYIKVFCAKGAGTKDDALIRVIVSRCEVDMVQIKQEFQRLHGKTLESFIEVQVFSFGFKLNKKSKSLLFSTRIEYKEPK